MISVVHGIHRLKEAVVPVREKLTAACECLHGSPLPDRVVAFDEIDRFGIENKETTVNPAIVAFRLLIHIQRYQIHLRMAGTLGLAEPGEWRSYLRTAQRRTESAWSKLAPN